MVEIAQNSIKVIRQKTIPHIIIESMAKKVLQEGQNGKSGECAADNHAVEKDGQERLAALSFADNPAGSCFYL